MTPKARGFTLVELMIVLVIISVIAAFAIPNLLESQKAGRETGVEKSLKTIVDAESNFMKADYDNDGKDFCFVLATLHDQTDAAGNQVQLIPSSLASGSKEGFDYGVLATYDTAGGTDPRTGFAYCAVPTQYGTTGRRSYIVNHTGQIFYKDTGDNTTAAPGTNWPDTANDASWIALSE